MAAARGSTFAFLGSVLLRQFYNPPIRNMIDLTAGTGRVVVAKLATDAATKSLYFRFSMAPRFASLPLVEL